MTIEPEAALTMINDMDWEKEDMETLISLAEGVKNDEEIKRTLPDE